MPAPASGQAALGEHYGDWDCIPSPATTVVETWGSEGSSMTATPLLARTLDDADDNGVLSSPMIGALHRTRESDALSCGVGV